jgi:TatD DNase family protein
MKDMFERSKAAGLRSFIITGGSLSESSHAISLAKEQKLFCTAGCHPTRSAEFDKHPGGADVYLKELDELIGKSLRDSVNGSSGEGRRIVVAIGECGLGISFLKS